MEVHKIVKEEHNFENVWTSEGKILYEDVSEENKIEVYFD